MNLLPWACIYKSHKQVWALRMHFFLNPSTCFIMRTTAQTKQKQLIKFCFILTARACSIFQRSPHHPTWCLKYFQWEQEPPSHWRMNMFQLTINPQRSFQVQGSANNDKSMTPPTWIDLITKGSPCCKELFVHVHVLWVEKTAFLISPLGTFFPCAFPTGTFLPVRSTLKDKLVLFMLLNGTRPSAWSLSMNSLFASQLIACCTTTTVPAWAEAGQESFEGMVWSPQSAGSHHQHVTFPFKMFVRFRHSNGCVLGSTHLQKLLQLASSARNPLTTSLLRTCIANTWRTMHQEASA